VRLTSTYLVSWLKLAFDLEPPVEKWFPRACLELHILYRTVQAMWSVCTVGRRRQNQLISRGDCLEVLTTVMIFDRRRRSQRRSHARFFYSRPLFKVEPAASRFFGNLCDRYIFSLLHKTKTLKPVSNQIKTRNVQRTPKKLNRAMAGQLSLLARFSFSFSISFAG